MSYDISLITRDGEEPSAAALAQWLEAHPNWDVDRSFYDNAETGVYLMADFSPESEEEDEEQEGFRPLLDGWKPWVTLSVNFWRPSPFIDEACVVVRELIDQFGGEVSDPQTGVTGPFDGASMGQSWRATNGAVAPGMRAREGAAFLKQHALVSGPTLQSAWRWNFARRDEYKRLQERNLDIFLPRIVFQNAAGRGVPTIVWPDAIPIAVPHFVECVLLGYSRLSRRSGVFGPKVEQALIPWRSLHPLVTTFAAAEVTSDGTSIFGNLSGQPPKRLLETFREAGAPVDKSQLTFSAFDTVLDEEFFEPRGLPS